METEYLEKRRFKRVRYQEPVHYQFKEQGKFGGCLASDLSEGGIKISMNDFVPLHTEIAMRLKLQDVPHVVDLTGRVAWVQQVPYSDRYRAGVEFVNESSNAREGIQSYVRSRRF
ncbi:MAG: PilZ domain-containing protein [Candidatus Omnitrophota bacterium]